MKKQFFLFPLLAALAMTACSSDDDLLLDEPAATPENGEGSGNYGYIAVNIIRGNETGSRADNDNFAYGTDEENEAKNATFYVFDESGNLIGTPYTHSLTEDESVPGDGPSDGTADGNIERKYQVVLVIDGKSSSEFGSPKSIVCLLNAPAFEGTPTLSNLKEKVADYCTNNQSKGMFVMSNAVYVDGEGNTVVGTPIKAENISNSSAEALANPVAIHVERVVAKVNLQKTSGNFNTESTTIKLNGTTDTELTPYITGIELANIAQTSYLLKNVDSNSNWGTTLGGNWWNDANNFRSYWENIPSDLAYTNQTYKEVVDHSYTDNTITSGDVLDKLGNCNKYIQPNTNQSQKTAVLVTAELRKSGETTGTSFVYLRGGYYETEKAMEAIAAYVQQWGYYYQENNPADETVFKRLTPGFFTWTDKHDTPSLTWLKSYEVVAHLNDMTPENKAYSIYKWNSETQKMDKIEDGIQIINDRLQGTASTKSSYAARYYNGGKCYYFVNIDQSPVAGAAVTAHTYDGVVRNHYYKLTLNGIGGLGIPVFDPTDIIIPEKLDDDQTLSYLAATVEVLSWKFVTQGVTFGTVTE